jgi:hypothetical protein
MINSNVINIIVASAVIMMMQWGVPIAATVLSGDLIEPNDPEQSKQFWATYRRGRTLRTNVGIFLSAANGLILSFDFSEQLKIFSIIFTLFAYAIYIFLLI